MNRTFFALISLSVAALLGGCTTAAPPEPTPSPTVSVTPSVTAPPTPSETAAPSFPVAPSPVQSSTTPTAPGTPSASVDLGTACTLSRGAVDDFVLAWERVTSSVDRPDHSKYTEAMIDAVAKAAKDAGGCAGSEHLPVLADLIQKIDQAGRAGEPAGDLIHEFALSGNDWLVALGYSPKLGE